jgi:Ca-activated chloride channel family protein
MRGLLLTVLLVLTGTAQANATWDTLWRTPDQRAERLLRQGHPAEAARLYTDPRRKAYAELQSGSFAQAAHDLASLDDSDSQYNRGNALARAGQLQAAIKAYDAALARNPNNRDAHYNRDLVERALKQQPPPPKSAGNDDKQQHDSGKGSDQQGNAGQDNNASAGKSGQNKQGQDSGKHGSQHPDQKSGQGQQAQNQSAQSPQSAQSAQPKQSAQSGQADQTSQANGQNEDDAAQAARDAAASLAKADAGQPTAAADLPATEQQLAQEQWLRRIPDDPGGLLRRKFMIEHMIRQQEGQP